MTTCCRSILAQCATVHYYHQFVRWYKDRLYLFDSTVQDQETAEKECCILFVMDRLLTMPHYDHLLVIRQLLAAGCNPNAQLRASGRTALHIAIINHCAATTLELLASNRCNLEIRDIRGATALHYACVFPFSDNVSALIRAGANVHAVDIDGKTCLQLAVEAEPMSSATRALLCKQLIVAGACVDTKDAAGNTPCHCAVTNRCLTLLIAAGADLNIVNNLQHSACYQMAVNYYPVNYDPWNSDRRFELLVAAGANYEARRNGCEMSARQIVEQNNVFFTAADLTELTSGKWGQMHRNGIEKSRLELSTALYHDRVFPRATVICIALQHLRLPALVTLAVVDADSDERAWVPMYKKWNLVTAVKHFV